jgi:hypothetical protein
MDRTVAGNRVVAAATGAQASDSAVGMAARGWAWLTHSSHCSTEGWKCAATWLTNATWLAATIRASSRKRRRVLVTMATF